MYTVARKRRVVGVVTSILVSGVLAMAAAPAAAFSPASLAVGTPTSAAVTHLDTASTVAAETGEPTVVESETTESTSVTAMPDGTFELVANQEPVRVRRGDGWVPIDTDLQVNADGSLSPAATTMDVTFSGGGDRDAINLAAPGIDLSLDWPSTLPAPTVVGNTATYAEVFPGVDLTLTALANSYQQVLVVRNATAAANPAVRQLKMTADGDGARVVETADGRLNALSDSGEVVWEGASPVMWDSTPDPATGDVPSAADPEMGSITSLGVDVSPTPAQGDGDAASVVVSAPSSALTGSSVTYPVFIDPGGGIRWSV